MCGICGKFEFDAAKRVSPSLVKAMADTLSHRGPDDEGVYVKGPIGLGFRRLSIIDLAAGHQPLSNEDGRIWIVFNGEIYNYKELRQILLAKGHSFRTESDTEVIVHLYEEHGRECVEHLRGMFGFAIWDSTNSTLLLARDRVGIKPLYYYLGKDFVSFGSEMKAILADPAVEREIDPQIIDRFLTYFYVPGADTLIRGLHKLEPGHTLTVRRGTVEKRRYWDLQFPNAPVRGKSTTEYEEELTALLKDTVRLHMISDVPVGCLLSGGLDSTAMLSFATDVSGQPLNTYTVGFSSKGVIDERPFARLAAERYGAKHCDVSISASQFADFLPSYIRHMEEPVCEPPAVALYYVAQRASRDVKVLISGEGGDEAFAGYENYRNNFWLESAKRWMGPLAPVLSGPLERAGKLLGMPMLSKYAPRLQTRLDSYYLSRTSTPFQCFNRSHDVYEATIGRSVRKEDSMEVARSLFRRVEGANPLDQMLYVDTKTWLPDDLLVKADKMTMASSVELRVPFLDHKVLEFAAKLPRTQKLNGWRLKYLAKKALSPRLPKEIIQRRKAGFPVPYECWLQGEMRDLVADILLDSRTGSRGYFRPHFVESILDQHRQSGGFPKEIFSLMILELWHRTFLDSRPAEVRELAGAAR